MTKTERRKRMPECVRFADDILKAFPDAKIRYAEEGGVVWGERGEEGVTPVRPHKRKK